MSACPVSDCSFSGSSLPDSVDEDHLHFVPRDTSEIWCGYGAMTQDSVFSRRAAGDVNDFPGISCDGNGDFFLQSWGLLSYHESTACVDKGVFESMICNRLGLLG